MEKITASNPFKAYWESKKGYIYEVLGSSADYQKGSDAVHVLNMRTGKERILREKDFGRMRQLRREEAEEICKAEYGMRAYLFAYLAESKEGYIKALSERGMTDKEMKPYIGKKEMDSLDRVLGGIPFFVSTSARDVPLTKMARELIFGANFFSRYPEPTPGEAMPFVFPKIDYDKMSAELGELIDSTPSFLANTRRDGEITASRPFHVYWQSKSGHIYEVLSTAETYGKAGPDSIRANVLNMRTGKMRIMGGKDFDRMKQLSLDESFDINAAEYGMSRNKAMELTGKAFTDVDLFCKKIREKR